MTRQVYGAKDLQELLGVSESKAYPVYQDHECRASGERFLDRQGARSRRLT